MTNMNNNEQPVDRVGVYEAMFGGRSSLGEARVLPPPTFVPNMFGDLSVLTEARLLDLTEDDPDSPADTSP